MGDNKRGRVGMDADGENGCRRAEMSAKKHKQLAMSANKQRRAQVNQGNLKCKRVEKGVRMGQTSEVPEPSFSKQALTMWLC